MESEKESPKPYIFHLFQNEKEYLRERSYKERRSESELVREGIALLREKEEGDKKTKKK